MVDIGLSAVAKVEKCGSCSLGTHPGAVSSTTASSIVLFGVFS